MNNNVYEVEYSGVYKEWFVVNTKTGMIQSAWKDKVEARSVVRLLNIINKSSQC